MTQTPRLQAKMQGFFFFLSFHFRISAFFVFYVKYGPGPFPFPTVHKWHLSSAEIRGMLQQKELFSKHNNP